jgi:hypothetical protein
MYSTSGNTMWNTKEVEGWVSPSKEKNVHKWLKILKDQSEEIQKQ